MTQDSVTSLMVDMMGITIKVAMPMLLAALIVGLLISVFQAVTQIQEQTLTFVPKIAAMVAAAILLMPWIGMRLMEYSSAMFGSGQLP
jgi:flagellar biosynthesis protein FliQ